jgi:hypothetical protein
LEEEEEEQKEEEGNQEEEKIVIPSLLPLKKPLSLLTPSQHLLNSSMQNNLKENLSSIVICNKHSMKKVQLFPSFSHSLHFNPASLPLLLPTFRYFLSIPFSYVLFVFFVFCFLSFVLCPLSSVLCSLPSVLCSFFLSFSGEQTASRRCEDLQLGVDIQNSGRDEDE